MLPYILTADLKSALGSHLRGALTKTPAAAALVRAALMRSIDLDKPGDGRWGIEWYPVICNVGTGRFQYHFGGQPNPYWCLLCPTDCNIELANTSVIYLFLDDLLLHRVL